MRILICEDSVLLREGLVRLLEDAGHEVVAALPDTHGLTEAVAERMPQLCILDVRLPPTFTDEGIRAALSLRASHPQLPLLVLSQYVEERYASDLIAAQGGPLGTRSPTTARHARGSRDLPGRSRAPPRGERPGRRVP